MAQKHRQVQTDEPVVVMQHVNKWFGQFHVLRDINLRVAKGERIVVCGPTHNNPLSLGNT